MSRYKGGFIKSTPITTSRFGTNSGMFSLGQQIQAIQGGLWPSDYDQTLVFQGSSTWACPPGVSEIEYLLLAGGGGGGTFAAGGGGAGGIRLGSGFPVTAGQTYTINVGSGGVAGPGGAPNNEGGNGGGSFIQGGSPITHLGANGGGGGAIIGGPSSGHQGGCGGGGGFDVAPAPTPEGDGGLAFILNTANGLSLIHI